jgi:hypothetical protein
MVARALPTAARIVSIAAVVGVSAAICLSCVIAGALVGGGISSLIGAASCGSVVCIAKTAGNGALIGAVGGGVGGGLAKAGAGWWLAGGVGGTFAEATSQLITGRYSAKSLAIAFGAGAAIGGIAEYGSGAIANLRGSRGVVVTNTVDDFADHVFLVRGGTNTPERFAGGSGVTSDGSGRLNGVSVNSGSTVEEAARGIPNKQIGVSTASEVRGAGGTVVRAPTSRSPGHCLIGGLTTEAMSELFTPTVKNPCL